MGHITTKLHQFLISIFQDFVRTDTQTLAKTIPTCSMRARAGSDMAVDRYQSTRRTMYQAAVTVRTSSPSTTAPTPDSGHHWRNFTLKSGGDQWRRQDLVSRGHDDRSAEGAKGNEWEERCA